jgi:large subunit ribosomal protein L22
MSPRKVRRVADLVRGKKVNAALDLLHFTPKAAAKPLAKVIHSAAANFLNNTPVGQKVDPDSLVIKELRVDEGPTLKRYRAGSMGRVMRIRKRTSHIFVRVGTLEETGEEEE